MVVIDRSVICDMTILSWELKSDITYFPSAVCLRQDANWACKISKCWGFQCDCLPLRLCTMDVSSASSEVWEPSISDCSGLHKSVGDFKTRESERLRSMSDMSERAFSHKGLAGVKILELADSLTDTPDTEELKALPGRAAALRHGSLLPLDKSIGWSPQISWQSECNWLSFAECPDGPARAALSAMLLLILRSMLIGSWTGLTGLAALPRWRFITDWRALRGLTEGCFGSGWAESRPASSYRSEEGRESCVCFWISLSFVLASETLLIGVNALSWLGDFDISGFPLEFSSCWCGDPCPFKSLNCLSTSAAFSVTFFSSLSTSWALTVVEEALGGVLGGIK